MTQIDQKKFIQALSTASQVLNEKKEDINRLNVFPVPDGDTGTNMSMTIDTVIAELAKLPADASRVSVLKAITHGSLMGARGNSGVITSQILRGVCEGLEEATEFTAETIAHAADRGVEVAFNAVRKPVEGTILTVLKDSAKAAQLAYEDGADALESLSIVSAEAMASVRRTPELLPVLKENGVVDAGGFGLAILLEAFTAALSGVSSAIPSTESLARPEPLVAIEQINDWEGSDYLYCTEFLLEAWELNEEETHSFLCSMGDCELLVGASPHYKVHVHTDDPGGVLEYMTERGQVSEVFIHNMRLQSEERAQGLVAGASAAGAGAQMAGGSQFGGTAQGANGAKRGQNSEPRKIGFVAVASGTGTVRILESQDVDYVVRGGQTMNPATKDFVDAIEAVNAESVIIFPNNKNIIMAANAAVAIASKPAAVVPTTSVPQSFSALFVADRDASLEENVQVMTEVIAEVKTAEITTAIKKARAADGRRIVAGDIIGITADEIVSIGKSVPEVAMELLTFIAEDADILTLLAGEEFDDEQLQALSEQIEEAWPELETDCQRGDQPLYPLILAAE